MRNAADHDALTTLRFGEPQPVDHWAPVLTGVRTGRWV
jgi:hypothetical protein